MNKVVHLTNENFELEVLKNSGVTLVDFWASWCGPCKMIGPVLDELAVEMTDAKIAKVNVDDEQELAAKFGIRSIPTLIIFKNGEKVEQMVGVLPKESIKAKIEAHK
jgi:thioredoxin 1